MTLKTRKSDMRRFFEKVNQSGPTPTDRPELGPCWVWTCFVHDGYGRFWFEGRQWPAHRWLFEQLRGVIPAGYEPDHLCRNRACVNPDHIEVVTQAEDVRRGGVFRRGHAYGNAAIQAARTHCPRNHPYDEANTRIYAGRRHCRACGREGYHRRKATAS